MRYTKYALLILLIPLTAQAQHFSAASSAGYLSVPASVSVTEGVSVKSAVTSATYSYLALASYKMHTVPRGGGWYAWEQRDLDATVMAMATVAADAWEPIVGDWAWGSLAPVAAYYLLTEQKPIIYPKDPILHTAIWTGIAFTGLALTEGWEMLLPAVLFAASVYIRVGMDADGSEAWHGVWHAGSAVAAGVALNLDNFNISLR